MGHDPSGGGTGHESDVEGEVLVAVPNEVAGAKAGELSVAAVGEPGLSCEGLGDGSEDAGSVGSEMFRGVLGAVEVAADEDVDGWGVQRGLVGELGRTRSARREL